MKPRIEILLIAAFLVPLAGLAREETMQERKQRIMRKYLRQRTDMVQSDMLVPEEVDPDDVAVTDSERFKDMQIDLKQEQSTLPPPVQIPRRAPPKQEERNWLLSEDPEAADSKAPVFGESADPLLREWDDKPERTRTRKESQPAQQQSLNERRGNTLSERFSQQQQGWFKPRTKEEMAAQQDSSFPWARTPTEQRETTDALRIPMPFSRTSRESTRRDDGSFGSEGRTFGSQRAAGSDVRQERRSYQPRSFAQPGTETIPGQQIQQQPVYQSTYDKWKKERKEWDPTRDDAFLNELMPNSSR